MTVLLRHPALVVHAFLPAARVLGPTDSPARRALDDIWARMRAAGYRDRMGSWPTELVLPAADDGQDTLTVLGAAAKPTVDGSRELLVYRVRGVIGVSTVDATRRERTSWADFDHGWLAELGHLDRTDLIDTVLVHSGLSPRRSVRSRPSEPPAESCRRLAGGPPDLGPGGPPRSCWHPTEGMTVWELPRDPGTPASRRLLAVAGADDEQILDEWLWTSSSPGLPPFTRYLIQAGKLRYHRAVLRRDLPRLRGTVQDVGRLCDRLDAMLHGADVPLERILEANRKLADLGTRQKGLIEQLSDVRAMTGTVEIIRRNLDAIVDQVSPTDHETADWTLDQLRAEERYLSAAQLKAAELGRLATSTVSTRLEERKANLTLFQTVALGSVLMALAAIQSLGYKVPLTGRLQAPTIFLLAAVALTLPWAVVRWLRGAPYHRRWAVVDVAFAALMGAAAAWFARSFIVWWCTAFRFRWDWSVAVTVGAATAGAAVGAGIALLRLRQLRKSST
ncbi:CATRA conflict system CASPASE/TPR repeat-associated protein [Micromonospora mangrovi]|uniref:CATRA conflict system CASPASE/TPR repeat-associated protein n=2 Tax=Micromonospora TaxID=1873 RepID=A0AAU8HFM3_9ACTN